MLLPLQSKSNAHFCASTLIKEYLKNMFHENPIQILDLFNNSGKDT